MIETMNFNKSRDGYVKYSFNSDLFQLIMDDKKIVFLKIGDFVLINKFITNRVLNMFDDDRLNYYSKHFCEYDDDFRKLYGVFEFDKTYLNFASSGCFFTFDSQKFSKDKYNVVREFFDLCDYDEERVYECGREDLKKLFNYNNYDSMYVFNDNGNFLFAGNKVDGVVLDEELVPSDEKIIRLDLINRRVNAVKDGCSTMNVKEIGVRNIDEIEDVYIYGDDRSRYFSVVSENGQFSVNMFSLKYVGKGKYILGVKKVNNKMLSNDDVKCKVKSK